jgi:hypothetical protein
MYDPIHSYLEEILLLAAVDLTDHVNGTFNEILDWRMLTKGIEKEN